MSSEGVEGLFLNVMRIVPPTGDQKGSGGGGGGRRGMWVKLATSIP